MHGMLSVVHFGNLIDYFLTLQRLMSIFVHKLHLPFMHVVLVGRCAGIERRELSLLLNMYVDL